MKKRKDIAILVFLFLAVVGLTALTLTSRSREGGALELIPLRTSYSTKANGTKALFVTLDELGVPVERRTTSFEDLPESSSLLFVVSPLQPITRAEWEALRDWVAGGRYACLGIEDQLIPGWAEEVVSREDEGTFTVHPASPLAATELSRRVKEINFRGLNRLDALPAVEESCEAAGGNKPAGDAHPRDDSEVEEPPGGT